MLGAHCKACEGCRAALEVASRGPSLSRFQNPQVNALTCDHLCTVESRLPQPTFGSSRRIRTQHTRPCLVTGEAMSVSNNAGWLRRRRRLREGLRIRAQGARYSSCHPSAVRAPRSERPSFCL